MSRKTGVIPYSSNFEVLKTSPLDSRCLVDSYSDLTKNTTWANGKDSNYYVYKGMIVSCKDQSGKLYQLVSEDFTNQDNWKIIGDNSELEESVATNTIDITSLKESVSTLNTNLTEEITRAKGIETANTTAIETEKNRAVEAENKISESITKNSNDIVTLSATVSSHTDTINTEVTRATTAETELSNKVSANTTDLKSVTDKVATLITDLSKETTRAQGVESNNTKAITDEGTRAKAAEEALKESIDKNTTDITSVTTAVGEIKLQKEGDLSYALYVNGTKHGEITIPQDQFLRTVNYDATTKSLVFVFKAESGDVTESISIGDLVDTYTSGEGLLLNGNAFSVDFTKVASVESVSNAVSKEKERAIGQENILLEKINTNSTDLNSEIVRAKEAEKVNAAAIAQEIQDARAAEKVNSDAIAANAAAIEANEIAIADEVTRAKKAEQTNTDAITTEITRATAEEKALGEKINSKVDKIEGKSLSTNDYTTAEKTKLAGIADNANNYTLPTATESILGGVKVDTTLSSTSTNPVQNKVIHDSINNINSSISSISSTIAEMSCVYGVRHNYNNSSPVLTRIGTPNLHVTLPVQSLMRRCILADDGTVVYYLDPNDSTKKADGTDAVLDGTDGQVMVEIPTHYRRCTLGTDYYDVEISLVPFTNAKKINKFYVSAYEAALDRTNLKLASVVNTTVQYRGGNNTSSWDDTYRSLLGMPVTNINTVTFHTYGTNRGTGWDMYEVDIHDTIAWLFYIEYATLNSQTGYNADLTTEGYHQGGLGNGVVGKNWSTWTTYNSNNPIIPCGTTNSLGNNSGVVSYSPLSSEGSTAWGTFNVPSYRGIENPYAHIWKWAVGYMGVGNSTNQVAYRCRNRNQYSTGNLNSYYNQIGLVSSSGQIKTIVKNEYGDIIPTSVGGSDTTYFSDYLQESHTSGSILTARVGGSLSLGSGCGFGCLYLDNGFGDSGSYGGSRLCFCEKNQIVEEL